ncbi:MAG: hypothetical protein Q9170_000732 [Blastenia crenularia]
MSTSPWPAIRQEKMNDPSDGVPAALMRHIHLVSSFNFPTSAGLQLETIVDRLLAAPSIATDVKPMNWMFIEAPKDGVSMLVWQPLSKLGTEFATDGYIWADAEQAFSSQAKGYTVEMYLHRSGYRYGEPVATHQRRRYRLMPGHNPNPNAPPPDPSLWIVHYSQADPAQHLPSHQIPISADVQSLMTQRRYLQQHGQLIRKEFMLHDQNSWPTIGMPGTNPGMQASAYPNNVISHMNRQQPGYVQSRAALPNQAAGGPPPAKRARHQTISDASGAGDAFSQAIADSEPTVNEEEDVSRGDFLDFLTPRDISAMRYKEHHEWLGEIFRSPYDTQQILPGQLGLGRKGELETLTKEFFNAPTEPSSCSSGAPPARVGRMESGKAADFTRMANERIADINAQIEKMKRQHAKRMAKLLKGSELLDVEKALRVANTDFRVDHSTENSILDDGDNKVRGIRSNIESILGKKIEGVKDAECVQKGALQEKVNDSENIDQDYDFSDQAADLTGQIPAFQTPQEQLSSMEHTPGLTGELAAASNGTPNAAKDSEEAGSTDVAMGGMQDEQQAGEGEVEDWVVVNKEGDDSKDTPNEELPDLDAFANDPAMGSNVGTPGEHVGTVVEDPTDLTPAAEDELGPEFVANDFAEGVDFGNLDTAGEALSGYGAEESMGIDDTVDLGLDDTAFGEAFQNNNS